MLILDCAFGAWGEDVGCWPNFVFEDEDGGDDGDDGGDSYCPDGTQVCLSLDGGDLNYSSTEDIAGFHFLTMDAGASGGDAEEMDLLFLLVDLSSCWLCSSSR